MSSKQSVDILIIEDNEDAALLLSELLRTMGHSVRIAYEGEEGLKLARQAPPKIAICDIELREMTGYQLARAFRGDPALCDVKLVAMTGYGRSGDVKKSREAGFDRHMTKPLDIKRLESALLELLD